MMRPRVRKLGDGLPLCIPSALAEDAQLQDGTETEAEVAVADGRLVVGLVVTLAALVARIMPENLPDLEFEDVPGRGVEAW